LLAEKAEQIYILRLQGFLFFGTAQNLLNRIRERIRDPQKERLNYILLDFHRVTDLDSSAVMSFTRLYQLAAANQIHLLMTEVKPEVRQRLLQGGLVEDENPFYKMFPSLDYGMEWYENRILAEDKRSLIMKATTLQAQLKKIFHSAEEIACFMKYLEKQEFGKGHVLINQGERPEAMYFVDAGRVSAQLETDPERVMRLKSMGGGTVVGEIGMYLNQTRTATIITDAPSIVYRLTKSSLEKMEKDDPELAAALHQWMARMLAERLSDNNRTLEALLA
jgi:SulP family sulfate permease